MRISGDEDRRVFQPDTIEDRPAEIRFCGHDFVPMESGALFWPARNALLVADLHLEKHAAFAMRGQFLPPYDTAMTLARLEADLAATGASMLIALGDSFHRDEGVASLSEMDRARIARMGELCEWIWLSGNHDPAPHGLGGRCLDRLVVSGVTLTHAPCRSTPSMMAGHLHPGARVMINGRSVRRPCFVNDERLMILPAYGASAGSLNVLSLAFAGLFDWSRLAVTMLGRGRLYPVSPRRLVAG